MSVEVSIGAIEKQPEACDEQGHAFDWPVQTEGINEGSVDVVGFPHDQKDKGDGAITEAPQHEKSANSRAGADSMMIQPGLLLMVGPQPLRMWRP